MISDMDVWSGDPCYRSRFDPTEILNPRNTWADKNAYDTKTANLAASFVKNFAQYAEYANEEILSAAPKIEVHA